MGTIGVALKSAASKCRPTMCCRPLESPAPQGSDGCRQKKETSGLASARTKTKRAPGNEAGRASGEQ
jgi:hypothetical protein